jgi:hypothetical protein
LAAVAIHDDLVATLGLEAINYPSLVYHLQPASLAISDPGTAFSQFNTEPDDCDEAILLALNQQLFAPIRQFARITHLRKTMIHRRLTRPLGFHVRHLRWVLHRLSDTQQSNQIELSRTLLSLLTTQQRRYWHDIAILDESWFYRNTDYELIWLRADEKVSERQFTHKK